MEFKAGDVVQLKSGSPSMTISEIVDNDSVVCEWHSGKHQRMERQEFKVVVLKKYEPSFI